MSEREKGKICIENAKIDNLYMNTDDGSDEARTTNQRLRISDDHNSLSSGEHGPSLTEDFRFREKINHFVHERIPERNVDARGAAAHGYFESYGDFSEFTKADFLGMKGRRTPVFARFSTIAGFTGFSALARDVKGFAVKFYTDDGDYDLVGNNVPVFFIKDAIKFPDLIYAAKPEQHNEIQRIASAKDAFWDFISLRPESMHMIMWLMSDRALPRSFSTMEGFGVHTFRFINENNESHFVKFHWKPRAGTHSVSWDETQKISGQDPDFHRRELWNAIEKGNLPEWDLGVQLVPEKDEHMFDFDLLDPTKLIPEELVPIKLIGKMVLNANPSDFFAETEQVAFHPGHLVPGIDFSSDPLLQGRRFSYPDTQLSSLGGLDFNEIPINRPIVPVQNNRFRGHMRQEINLFPSYLEKIDGDKIRKGSSRFADRFSQAKLFFESQTKLEQAHIIEALRFELGKVTSGNIKEGMVRTLSYIDDELAKHVAQGLGINHLYRSKESPNHSFPVDTDPLDYQPRVAKSTIGKSEKLSLMDFSGRGIKGRRIAVLAADGVDTDSLNTFLDAIEKVGADAKVISIHGGFIGGANGEVIKVDQSLLAASSVLFDAVFVPAGMRSSRILRKDPAAIRFLDEAYKHCKYIAINGAGEKLWEKTYASRNVDPKGVLFDQDVSAFIKAVAQHRIWEREDAMTIPV